MKTIWSFLKSEEAATAVEYAVLLALILMSVIASISSVGAASGGMWGNIDAELGNIF